MRQNYFLFHKLQHVGAPAHAALEHERLSVALVDKSCPILMNILRHNHHHSLKLILVKMGFRFYTPQLILLTFISHFHCLKRGQFQINQRERSNRR